VPLEPAGSRRYGGTVHFFTGSEMKMDIEMKSGDGVFVNSRA